MQYALFELAAAGCSGVYGADLVGAQQHPELRAAQWVASVRQGVDRERECHNQQHQQAGGAGAAWPLPRSPDAMTTMEFDEHFSERLREVRWAHVRLLSTRLTQPGGSSW